MARLDAPQARAITPLRLFAILVFLLAVSGGLIYLFGMPLKMLYWGVYARVRPMVSETDLIRKGKPLPAGAQLLPDLADADQPDAVHRQSLRDAAVEADRREGGGGGDQGSQQEQEPESEELEPEPLEPEQEPDPEPEPEQPQDAEPAAQDQQSGDGAEPVTGGGRDFALTKDMVAKVAQDNMVLVTWANYHYRDFVMNWVEHLRAVQCTAFIVGAMDDKLLHFLVEREVPTFSMSSGLTLDDFGWGSPTFHKMGREKIHLIHSFTKMGFDVLISDVDTVWLRNPLPYMKQYPEADILTSSDHLANTATDEGLERWPEAASAANIGIMLFRPKAHELSAEWVDMLDKDDSIWDQNGFNDLMRRGSQPLPDREDRLFSCYHGKLKCGILPVSIFCSGHTGFTQDMSTKLGLKPYVVHATFQFSGTPGKRHRMRERGWWNDPPEYFSSPAAGFLVYDYDVPQTLLDAAANVERNFTLEATTYHFDLVNHQLRQLRVALVLATVTGRAVVLPRLMCGMDRWWAPHDGTIPGSALTIPYQCPADHVLDLEAWDRNLAEQDFGPSIGYREWSFLDRPEAAELNKSTAVVTVCQDGSEAGCDDGASAGAAVKLKPGLNEEQLRAALGQGPAAEAKVLRISGGIERLFSGWTDAVAGEKFKRRVDQYSSIWCCVDAHPGHIWYDFFWDVVPHQDRHNREVDGRWKPQTGP